MPAAVGANDLRPRDSHTTVFVSLHRARDAVKIGGPATTGVKLGASCVQRRVAPGAGVHALVGVVLVVRPRAGGFGALLAEYAELFW